MEETQEFWARQQEWLDNLKIGDDVEIQFPSGAVVTRVTNVTPTLIVTKHGGWVRRFYKKNGGFMVGMEDPPIIIIDPNHHEYE